MKSRMNIMVLLATLMVVSLSAFAQTKGSIGTATVPFQFRLGDRLMPAGSYEVSQLSANTLALKLDGSLVRLALTHQVERTKSDGDAKLIFHHVGGEYFLSQVWKARSGVGFEMPQPKLQQELARGGSSTERVVIAARN